MSLTGINRKCARCIKECKQWCEVTVVYCPNFIDVTKDAKPKNHVDIKQANMPKQPVTAISSLE